MRRSVVKLAVYLISALPGAAVAQPVSQYILGTVTAGASTDTLGLFGPVGATLTGKAIEVYFQYLPSALTAAQQCPDESSESGCFLAYSKMPQGLTNPSTVASVLLAVTVNGRTVTYAPTMSGVVETTNENRLGLDVRLGGAPGQAFSEDALEVVYRSPVTIGTPLQPTNPPLLGDHGDAVYLEGPVSRPDGSLPSEMLMFSVRQGYK